MRTSVWRLERVVLGLLFLGAVTGLGTPGCSTTSPSQPPGSGGSFGGGVRTGGGSGGEIGSATGGSRGVGGMAGAAVGGSTGTILALGGSAGHQAADTSGGGNGRLTGTAGAAGTAGMAAGVAGAGAAGASGVGGAPASYTSPSWIADQCAKTPDRYADVYPPNALQSLSGRWALCGSVGLFGTNWAGVEVGSMSDSSFSFLTWSGDTLIAQPPSGHVYAQQSVSEPAIVDFENSSDATMEHVSMRVSVDSNQMLLTDTATGAQYRYLQLVDVSLGQGGAGGAGGTAGRGGAGGAGGGAGSSGDTTTVPVPCHVNGDCPTDSSCLIRASVASCGTASGTCIPVKKNDANCYVFQGPCGCLVDALPCAQSSGGSFCRDINNGGYTSPDNCFGCFPSAAP